ncbi:hypothetical protein TNCV_2450991 [Trichonephila clavipes]|nr:hypothetical protein TNCV_2450991 [Trichonephila clavipes]
MQCCKQAPFLTEGGVSVGFFSTRGGEPVALRPHLASGRNLRDRLGYKFDQEITKFGYQIDVFTLESLRGHQIRFELCPDGNHRCIWRRPGQRKDVALLRHTGPKQGVMVRSAISFDSS